MTIKCILIVLHCARTSPLSALASKSLVSPFLPSCSMNVKNWRRFRGVLVHHSCQCGGFSGPFAERFISPSLVPSSLFMTFSLNTGHVVSPTFSVFAQHISLSFSRVRLVIPSLFSNHRLFNLQLGDTWHLRMIKHPRRRGERACNIRKDRRCLSQITARRFRPDAMPCRWEEGACLSTGAKTQHIFQ